jgi:mycothiol synthase
MYTATVPSEKPQLHMTRPQLRDLPPLELPAGMTLRTFRDGDDVTWNTLLQLGFGDTATVSFDPQMTREACYSPDRIYFLELDGRAVATTSAYYRPQFRLDEGMIHFVSADPAVRGRGIGRLIVLAALQHMQREGRRGAWLSTDDFRLAAIKVYLDLGFVPLLMHDNQRRRWPAVLEKLKRGDMAAAFAPILDGPIWTPPPKPE